MKPIEILNDTIDLSCFKGNHKDLADKFREILDYILKLGEDELVEGLKAFIEAIVNENVSLVISRQLLSEVVQFGCQ